MENVFQSNRITAYRQREKRRQLIRGVSKNSKAERSALTGLTAIEYIFGLYEPTPNVEYGIQWGWTVTERAWRMCQDRSDDVTRRKTLRETSVPTSFVVRSQRDRNVSYNVVLERNWCDCPYKQGSRRKRSCKHICYVAYRYYIRPGRKLPAGLMKKKGMDQMMSRLLGGVCDRIGRPLFDIRTYRRREALRLASFMGDDDTLYSGRAVLRDQFTDRSTAIICLNNFYGSDANQRAITICNVARPMIRRQGNAWMIPCVETRTPGFSWKKLEIDVSRTVRQKFFYHTVRMGVTGCSCTCIVYREYGMVCEHIRAAFYSGFMDEITSSGRDQGYEMMRDAISVWAYNRSMELRQETGREIEHQIMARAKGSLQRRLKIRTGAYLSSPIDHVVSVDDRGTRAFFIGSYDRGIVQRSRRFGEGYRRARREETLHAYDVLISGEPLAQEPDPSPRVQILPTDVTTFTEI